MDSILQQAIAAACEDMGCEVPPTLDRFITLAIGWLGCRHGTVNIQRIEDSWAVTAGRHEGLDDTLAGAFADAVMTDGIWEQAKKNSKKL